MRGDRLIIRGWGERPLTYYLGRADRGQRLRLATVTGAIQNQGLKRVWVIVAGGHRGSEPVVPAVLQQHYALLELRTFGDKVSVALLERRDGPAAP